MEPLKKLDLPIDVENEAVILSNALKNIKHRELFTKTVNYLDFQYKENQVIAWTVQELFRNNVECDIDTIVVKSLSCPIKFKVDYELISQIMQNFNELPENNLRIHFNKLKTDKVKQELSDLYFKSIYTACLDPRIDINYLETRINYAKEIIQRNASVGNSQFIHLDTMVDNFIKNKSEPSSFKSTGFPALDDKLTDGYRPKGITVICGLPGAGKCHTAGTLILMYDGSYKKVEDIVVGDILMGPDSTPRVVKKTHVVKGTRHEIYPSKGLPYTVNENHLIPLVVGRDYGELKKGIKFNISASDFIKKSAGWRDSVNTYKVGIEFKERDLSIDPYYLGLWLGDGTSESTEITNVDDEIINYIVNYSKQLDLKCSVKCREASNYNIRNAAIVGYNRSPKGHQPSIKKDNYILKELQNLNLIKNKHIPEVYKINSRKNRLELLAGLLDTDGYLDRPHKTSKGLKSSTFSITVKKEELAKDIVFLARSLGFYVTCLYRKSAIKKLNFEGWYWNITISGNTNEIPTKLKRKQATERVEKYSSLVSKINIKVTHTDIFYGFELDGDHLYLLEDFTVSHNSSFTLSSMYNLSNIGTWCPQFALEMDSAGLTTKLASFASGIGVKRIAKEWNNFTDNERKLINYELERLKKNPFILCNDQPGQSLQSIREQILILQDRLDTEYMFVTIDLFGKIREFQESDNFARDYEKKLNITQSMAKELGVNLGLVAQINREVMKRRFNRPKMSDLKNAGAWEEVADLIIGIHRPYYDPEKALKNQISGDYQDDDNNDDEVYGDFNIDPTNLEENMAEAILLKQRMGEGNVIINFIFDPQTTRYIPVAQKDQVYVNLSKTSLAEM